MFIAFFIENYHNFVIMVKVVSILLSIFYFSFLFSQDKAEKEAIENYRTIANETLSNNEINEYIIKYKDSLNIFESEKNKLQIAKNNLILTKLYYKIGLYNNAIEYGNKAIKYFKELKDTTFLVYAYTTIGIIYGELDDFGIAEEYFQEIDTIASLSGKENLMYHNFINLGIMNLDKDINKAIEYFNKSEKYFSETKSDSITLIGLLNNKAIAYKRMNNYDKSISILLNINNTINNKHSYFVSVNSNLASTYLLKNMPDSALFFIKQALENPTNNLYLNNYVNSYRILTEAFILKHQPDSSIKYFKLYQLYNDSLVLKKKVENISKLNVIFETNKLIENVKLQKQKIEKYHSKIVNMSVGIIVLSLVIIIFIILYRKLQLSYKNIVKESVQSIKLEEENFALQNKINILENNKELETPNNNLNIENSDKIFDEIQLLMQTEKLFTNKDFDLNALANKLNSNRTYISNIINTKTNDSFVKFINKYRVKEAKKLLIDDQNKILTLDAIGKAAGFSSASTFNRVFKAETGVTPSFFVKNKANN